jgi:DNA-binding IclR family transcriptional regulator
VGTVIKALELLNLFTRQTPRIGLSEIARISGTNKATCFRLLTELQDYGLLEQDSESRDYRLGPAALRLAALREAAVPMRAATRPILEKLSADTGESAHSSILVGGRLQILDFAYSARHATKVIFEDTDVLPFHATSSGLAVLAHLPQAQRAQILAQPLTPRTAQTLTDPTHLNDALDGVRREGFALIDGGFEAEVVGIAVPVFGPQSTCLGALAVATPTNRITDDLRRQIIGALAVAGADLTKNLGGTVPAPIASLWQAIAAGKDIS